MITHGRFCSLTIAYLLNYSAPHKVRPHSNPRGWTFNFFDHLRKFDRIASRVIVSIKLLIESKLYVSLISLTSLFHWHEFPFRNSYVLTLFRQPGAVATEEKSSIEHYCSLMVHPFDTSEFNEKCEAQGLNLDQHSYTLLAMLLLWYRILLFCGMTWQEMWEFDSFSGLFYLFQTISTVRSTCMVPILLQRAKCLFVFQSGSGKIDVKYCFWFCTFQFYLDPIRC